MSPMFVSLLELLFNHWMKHGIILQHFTGGGVKLLRKNKHGGDGISNIQPLMQRVKEFD